MTLSWLRLVDLHHVLLLTGRSGLRSSRHVVVQRLVLYVVFILLFAWQSKFGTFVQLLSVAFPWNIHHDQVFSTYVKFGVFSWLLAFRIVHRMISIDRRALVSIDCSFGASVDGCRLLALHSLTDSVTVLTLNCFRMDIWSHRKSLMLLFVGYQRSLHASLVVGRMSDVVLWHLRVNVLSASWIRFGRPQSWLRGLTHNRLVVHPVERYQ